LRALVDTVLAFLDVLEAEGRAAKRGAIRLTIAAGLVAIALLVALFGLCLLLRALYLSLAITMTPAVAALLAGLIALLLSGGLLWIATRVNR
jgi:hypothetical protein